MKTIGTKTLYKYDARNDLRVWTLIASLATKETAILEILYGTQGGAMQRKTEQVKLNSSGRSAEEQAQLRFNSRINKQLDKGYKESIDEAKSEKGTNTLGLVLPMKAQVYEPEKHTDLLQRSIQFKYNGHRCLIYMSPNGPIAYSRNGKLIDSIPHILEGLEMPEGMYLDGELYVKGMHINDITSIVRCRQAESSKLRFIAFDTVDAKLPFLSRFDKLFSKVRWSYAADASIEIAPTLMQHGFKMLHKKDIQRMAVANGYEGLILRSNDKGYESGARARQVLKAKIPLDAEFRVVDVEASVDDWAVLICKAPNNSTFKVSAPGTVEQKKYIYDNSHEYIGRWVNIEFAEWTKYGLPFHPRAIYFRT